VLNPSRHFSNSWAEGQGEQRSLLPFGMGAVQAFTPARNMGAVFPYGSIGAVYPGMAAVEAMIGDRSGRPMIYNRAGYQLGAR
jgi:hypothetical protein